MTLDELFGLVLIVLGLGMFVIAARFERPMLGVGLVELLLKRLPPRGQKVYTVGMGIVLIVLGVIALTG